jgi:peptidoglycan L-alanyl-D-glutamate endopeptidase CwlK
MEGREMNLVTTIKAIQRHYGLHVDGVAGTLTMGAVWRDISSKTQDGQTQDTREDIDARSAKNLLTLDPKAREQFAQFYRLASATAATFGCDYILIGGNRTWDEQDALYAQGRSIKGSRRTNAKGGQSNHNFGIAGDFGVFRGKSYLDDSNPELAGKVHKACSMHAADCGLEWGGSWKSMTDLPHYEVATGLSMMQKRNVYKARGSVL